VYLDFFIIYVCGLQVAELLVIFMGIYIVYRLCVTRGVAVQHPPEVQHNKQTSQVIMLIILLVLLEQ